MSAEADRRAYLEALGIDVWTRRGAVNGRVAEVANSRADSSADSCTAPEGLDWIPLRQKVAACTLCALHKGRTQTVFGVGSESARCMIIGEAPGAEEDRQGEPFVGRAGKLLDEMLRAIGLERSEVYIANILKCRPPNNRDPTAEEANHCRGYLERQIDLLNPRLILAVGRIAAQQLLNTDVPVGQLRGTTHTLRDGRLPLVVTYHPAYLLRSPLQKRKAWEDLCRAKKLLAEPLQ
jgi:DNA polymerase